MQIFSGMIKVPTDPFLSLIIQKRILVFEILLTITAFLQCHSNHTKQYYLGNFQATLSNVKLLPSTILTSRFSFERNYLMSKLFSTHLFSLINAAHLHQSSDLSYNPPGLQFCVFLMRFLLPSVK